MEAFVPGFSFLVSQRYTENQTIASRFVYQEGRGRELAKTVNNPISEPCWPEMLRKNDGRKRWNPTLNGAKQ